MGRVITVSQINSYIKNMFQQDYLLSKISVKGEVSNCKYHSSGHLYFTLKDSGGTLSAIMFAGNVAKMGFKVADGMQVVVDGRIEVYERDGKYQLYASSIEKDGVGDLYQQFEELKKHFAEMGYFAEEYKRKIPTLSRRIGIVTSPTGAAIQDIRNISYRRNPYVSLILYPALVQGDGAPASIVAGINALDSLNLDVIIVGRGGGSIEDLWAFNEEIVAEAIFNANTPIISAVGHETDFTIADFVADLRAPTPSAAAELAVAKIDLIEQQIDGYRLLLNTTIQQIIDDRKRTLVTYSMRLRYLSPVSVIEQRRIYLDSQRDKLDLLFLRQLKECRHRLEVYASSLNGLSPLEKLSQGYSYTADSSGKNITSTDDVKVGDRLVITVKDGELHTTVDKIVKN